MTSPRRLAEEGTLFEREVLASAQIDAASDEGFKHALVTMGVGAGGLSATVSIAGRAAGGAVAHGAATSLGGAGLGAIVKGVAVAVVVAGTATAGWVTHVEHRSRARATSSLSQALATTPSPQEGEGEHRVSHFVPEPVAEAPSAVQTAPQPPRPMMPSAMTATSSGAAEAVNPAPSQPRPELSPASSLEAEIASLDEVRTVLSRHDGSEALRKLDDFGRVFPYSALADEALVLRVDALLEQGDVAAATSLSERFLAANPSSPHAPHLRRVTHK